MIHNGHIIVYWSWQHFCAERQCRWDRMFFFSQWHSDELRAAELIK